MPYVAILQLVLPVLVSRRIKKYNNLAICHSEEAAIIFRSTSVDYAVSGLALEQRFAAKPRPRINRVGCRNKQALIKR
jgi:hypothetical protein